jgi:hypothetical protein
MRGIGCRWRSVKPIDWWWRRREKKREKASVSGL